MPTNPFADDWRASLRAHYTYVIRQDPRTLATLNTVMHEVGFTDAELKELYIQATMRDMPDDFVPPLDAFAPAESAAESTAVFAVPEILAPPEVVPLAAVPEMPQDVPPDEALLDYDETELDADPDAELEPSPEEAPAEPEDDTPQQLSLF